MIKNEPLMGAVRIRKAVGAGCLKLIKVIMVCDSLFEHLPNGVRRIWDLGFGILD